MTRAALVLLLATLVPVVAGCAKSASDTPGAPPAANAPAPANLLRQSAGDVAFGFVPPDGWKSAEMPGLKFKVILGPSADGFAPNINVVDESFGGSLDAYVKANLDTVQKAFVNGKLVSQEPFATDTGVPGHRAVVENTMQGKKLRQIFYFFGKDKTKLVVTCSAAASAPQDAAFEASMKSFRFE